MEPGTTELSAAAPAATRSSPRQRVGISFAIIIIQAFLFLVHAALYATWVFFWGRPEGSHALALPATLAILSVSFVAASLLAHRFFNSLVRVVYTLAAVWLGLVNFLFLAACGCWITYGALFLFGAHFERRTLAAIFLFLGMFTGVCAIVNASWVRVVRVVVKLPNLPNAWRGRTAAVASDLHLGALRNAGFLRRIVRKLSTLRPDVIFITGDLFDGTPVDEARLAKPLRELSSPLGSYFITGNHEQFTNPSKYLGAIRQSGIRILENEKIVLDGLQIVGVHYRDSADVERFREILGRASLNPNAASILLVHNPNRLPVAADAGISLQISGHTHLGQFFPWTWVVSRVYGPFAYGLNRFGELLVYTSCGAGTWGPPMRLGSNPEIVLIRFE